MKQVLWGLGDHYDIKMLNHLMLIRVAHLCPDVIIQCKCCVDFGRHCVRFGKGCLGLWKEVQLGAPHRHQAVASLGYYGVVLDRI